MLRNLLTTSVRSGMSRVAASTSMTRVAPALVAPTTMSLRFQNQKINADELKTGMLVEHDGKKMSVLSFKAAMMGRRPTSLHVELKDMATGKVYPVRYNPSDRVERMIIDTAEYVFLYIEGNIAYIMHPETFEQVEFDAAVLGNRAVYFPPNGKVSVSFYQGQVFQVTGPQEVVVTVAECDEYSAEKRSTNETEKLAKLDNGRTIKVPRYVQPGAKIRIKVADESFVGRADEK